MTPASVALTGAGYQVDSPTEVKDFLGRFSIRSDWGPLDATGATILSLRIAEMPALAELERVSRLDVFSRAIAESAGKTVDGIVRVVRDPVGTVAGIPAGVGRLMSRTAGMVGNAASAVSASMQSGGGDAGSAGSQATDFAKELAGLNRARRSIARSMGIDPYTGNPLVQRRLEDLAWASVAGGVDAWSFANASETPGWVEPSAGYFPYVQQCASTWIPVLPQAPSAAGAPSQVAPVRSTPSRVAPGAGSSTAPTN